MTPIERLQTGLRALHWSQHALAAETARTPTTVRRWVTGTTPVPTWVLAGVDRLVALHRDNPIAPE